jgi:hypothetical protein
MLWVCVLCCATTLVHAWYCAGGKRNYFLPFWRSTIYTRRMQRVHPAELINLACSGFCHTRDLLCSAPLAAGEEVYETKPTDEKSKVLMNKLCKMFEDSFPKQRSTKRANQIDKANLPEATRRRKDELRQMGERIKREKNLEMAKQQSLGIRYQNLKISPN